MLRVLASVLGRTQLDLRGGANDEVFFKSFDKDQIETWCLVKDKKEGKTEENHLQTVERGKFSCEIVKMDTEKGKPRKNHAWLEAAWEVDYPQKKISGTEFFHELAVSYLVSKYLADLPSFSISKFLGADFSSPANAFTLQLKGGNVESFEERKPHLYFRHARAEELEDVLNDKISAEQLLSIIQQVLVSIRLAQHRIKLKHHDLHLGNVLVLDGPNIIESYETPEGIVNVSIVGARAVIIDYGLSAATDPESGLRMQRIDEQLLIGSSNNESDDGWGVWGSELDGDEGYDVAMFSESLTEILFKQRPLDVSKIAIVARLQEHVNVNFTDRGRPEERTGIDWTKLFRSFNMLAA